jgi:protein-S-isoprenylcysteine O-methyltransferase Ste14
MKEFKDSPGVFIPPPLFYVVSFIISIILQRFIPIKNTFLQGSMAMIIGSIAIAAGLFFSVPAVRQFIISKNTLIPFKSASSLQTSGIYSVSRNPMYTGLLLTYTGLALIFGNCWTFILIPVLIVMVTIRIILPEERYLTRAFGNNYEEYRKKVRRWI